MRRTFTDPQTQRAYDKHRAAPPTSRGTGQGSAYFQGLERPDGRRPHLLGSLAYAAWAAGVDTARYGPLLTEEQRAAVVAYAKANGRDWRAKLHRAWMSGGNEPGTGGILRQLRNTHGPAWLAKFNLKAEA